MPDANCVTGRQDDPAAVLIRSIWPVEGLAQILRNRHNLPLDRCCDGPAKLCQALTIDRQLNGVDLTQSQEGLWIEPGQPLPDSWVTIGPRVGISSVPEPWLSMPWRYLARPPQGWNPASPRSHRCRQKARLQPHQRRWRPLPDAADILSGTSRKGRLARLLPFLGPAFIASVAYVDPGNFATNISGGAKFGYILLWVILASNLMAMLIQSLSAKLGIATGQNLAEHCRNAFPRPVVYGMWVLMELVAMATDLAEFLGAALGFNLLLGIPLWVAGILTAIATFLILGLERFGFRPLEAVITSLVGVVAISYVIETILDRPQWGDVLYHAVVPQFSGPESVLLATGILGATVMPHAIYLHSALTQGRIVVKEPGQMRQLYHFELIDVAIAMGMASLVNGAMRSCRRHLPLRAHRNRHLPTPRTGSLVGPAQGCGHFLVVPGSSASSEHGPQHSKDFCTATFLSGYGGWSP